MPARHDMLAGTLDFLWRPWGSVELWEQPVTEPLRGAGVTTMLVSEHPHLFETRGENYHAEFQSTRSCSSASRLPMQRWTPSS